MPILLIDPTMLLITKGDFAEATMLLKTRGVMFESHDVIERIAG